MPNKKKLICWFVANKKFGISLYKSTILRDCVLYIIMHNLDFTLSRRYIQFRALNEELNTLSTLYSKSHMWWACTNIRLHWKVEMMCVLLCIYYIAKIINSFQYRFCVRASLIFRVKFVTHCGPSVHTGGLQ